jgi:hypothetical protein
MTPTEYFAIVALAGSILLCAWWALDRIEDANSAARARLASDVRSRQRLRAVVQMSERRQS